MSASGAAKGGGSRGSGTPTYVPLAMTEEGYDFLTTAGGTDCLGEDDQLRWKAEGSLAPGESFSFTPKVPACYAHPAAVSVVASWTGGKLELATEVADNDFASGDREQKGKRIVAPLVGDTAQLCMFPYYQTDGQNYTIRVTNVGTETANGILLDGRSENDWTRYYYPRCLNADADGDGWNDAFEHTMAVLTYYSDNIAKGSNYLRARSATGSASGEVAAYPPDINDDGEVTAADVLEVQAHAGEGNGIPLERISPNPSDAEYLYKNTKPWRRYDLNGDGWVDGADMDIVAGLLNEPVPMAADILAPTARLVEPSDGTSLPRGQYARLIGHAWDNGALTRVDYLVNGKILCSQTQALPSFGFESPLFSCWWQVPNKTGTFALSVRAYDGAGRSTTSPSVWVRVD